MSRNTRTGKVLEKLILPSLEQGDYQIKQQVDVGKRLGGGKHKLDCIAIQSEKIIFISLKWQQTGGTAEQKVPYELLCLVQSIKDNKKKYPNKDVKAYLVLGGIDKEKKGTSSEGWTLRDFYIKGGLDSYLHPNCRELVRIIKPEGFIALANRGEL